MLYKEGRLDRVGRTTALLLLTGFLTVAPGLAKAVSSVTLAWDASTSTDVVGYNLYYGSASATYTNVVSVGNATSLTVTGLTAGVTYYFAATAYDSTGAESDYSNETNYFAPIRPPTISSISDQITLENTATGPIAFTIDDPDDPVSSLALAATSSKPSVIPVAGIVFGGGGNNRTVTITPAAGQTGSANITITVSDGKATASITFAATVVTAPPPVVRITIQGHGKVTPDLNTMTIVRGHSYTLTAIPDAGQEFAGWTGDFNSMSPQLTLKLTNDLSLQANFVPSPFAPILGNYNGLFYETDLVRQESSGSFAFTLTSHGKYSGRLQLGAKHFSFTGKFSIEGLATNIIARPGTNGLTLHLGIGANGYADDAFGDLSDGSWVSLLSGSRAIFNTKSNPAPIAGTYTFFIPGSDSDPARPHGASFGTVRVSTAGVAKFAGALADGSRVSQSAALSRSYHWPLYVSLYGGNGSALSWLTFSNQSSSDINGLLSWIKLPNVKARYFPAGFDHLANAAGSAFLAPTSPANHILNMDFGSVDFGGGNLAADFSNFIDVGLSSKITNLSSNKLSMSFALTSGLYRGSVIDPSSGKACSFSGAVFQKLNTAYGFLLGTNLSSRVVISP